jgi:hypothetical protein
LSMPEVQRENPQSIESLRTKGKVSGRANPPLALAGSG